MGRGWAYRLKKGETLLVGSIFYWGHGIVKNPRRGLFDLEEARRLIEAQDLLAGAFGVGSALDVVAQTPEAMVRYIDFVAEATEGPILIDAVDAGVRLAGAGHALEIGLGDRAVYNSIAPWTEREELEALRDLGVRYGVIFTAQVGRKRLGIEERSKLLPGLLRKARSARLMPLVDLLLLEARELASLSRLAMKTREALRHPIGCGTGNVTTTWKAPGVGAVGAFNALASLYMDFLLYGPIEGAREVFPAVGAAKLTGLPL
ncbi:MAG: hypothetical protein HY555_06215 [Euryarchaeota archaeon]|nr:hypothetical protein [Euryarchaeota archaeon]